MKQALKMIFENDVIRCGLVLLVCILILDHRVDKVHRDLKEFARFKGCYL